MTAPGSSPPTLGLLMLETRFPRLPGDIGHPRAFPFPVRRALVRGATPSRVVRGDDPALAAPFIEAARMLVERHGVAAIATSCGFLARWQRELAAALPVPVWTSALLWLAELAPRRCGVITIEAASLGRAHFDGVGADPATPVEGIAPDSPLHRSLLEDLPTLDPADAERQVVAAGRRLVARHPEVEAIVLECTNLPPYAPALARATGRPVHDMVGLVSGRLRRLASATGRAATAD